MVLNSFSDIALLFFCLLQWNSAPHNQEAHLCLQQLLLGLYMGHPEFQTPTPEIIDTLVSFQKAEIQPHCKSMLMHTVTCEMALEMPGSCIPCYLCQFLEP
jgi:hypothetical protein